MNKMSTTQKVGLGLGLLGIVVPFIILGVNMGADKLATGTAVVGDAGSIFGWLMKIFGSGGLVSVGGIITFLIGLWNKSHSDSQFPIPLPNGTGFLLPSKVGPLAINPQGVTPEEISEFGSAALMYFGNRDSLAARNRFMAAFASLADVIPNVKAVMDDGELITRIRLFPSTKAASVQASAPLGVAK